MHLYSSNGVTSPECFIWKIPIYPTGSQSINDQYGIVLFVTHLLCWHLARRRSFEIWFTNSCLILLVFRIGGIKRRIYSDVIIGAMVQITSLSIVYSTVYSGTDQRKHQSSPSPAFLRGIQWWPVNSPHKCPVTRKCFHFMTSSWNLPAIPGALWYCETHLLWIT